MDVTEKDRDVLAHTLRGAAMREISLPAGVSIDGLVWRLCHATSDYEVSEYGHVRRRTTGRKTYPGKILSFCWHRAGYPRFKLTINGKHEYFEAHWLVAFAFWESRAGSLQRLRKGMATRQTIITQTFAGKPIRKMSRTSWPMEPAPPASETAPQSLLKVACVTFEQGDPRASLLRPLAMSSASRSDRLKNR